MKRRIAILGSTGSIGTQALSVAGLYPERFEIAALAAGSRKELLFEQARAFRPGMCCLSTPIPISDIPEDLRSIEWVMGEGALRAAAGDSGATDVLVSVVGMRGLESVLTALERGKRVLLANKEALVAGGALVMKAAGENALLPVDSEHSAIFQCLRAADGNSPAGIILTCSGGPFRTWDEERTRMATPEQALRHPSWNMGPKITVDCATLFNKALEVIEAKWLFGVAPGDIQVVVHPQSVVHSAVRFRDGSVIAQLGVPDMRLPILYAMAYPERLFAGAPELDLFSLSALTFERPDEKRFPALKTARECLASDERGGAACCVMNAANEVATSRFLKGGMPLHAIWDTVSAVLDSLGHMPAGTLSDVLHADALARSRAEEMLSRRID